MGKTTATHGQSPHKVATGSLSGWIGCGFGSGLSPIAPGTAGSLVSLLPAYAWLALLPPQPWWVIALALLAAVVLGIVCCGRAGRLLGQSDHPALVWDEFCGQWLVLLVVPVSWSGWLAAFVLFRVFDILKPWPVRLADRYVSGGLGVMLDDLLAAGYAMVALWLAQSIWPGLLLS